MGWRRRARRRARRCRSKGKLVDGGGEWVGGIGVSDKPVYVFDLLKGKDRDIETREEEHFCGLYTRERVQQQKDSTSEFQYKKFRKPMRRTQNQKAQAAERERRERGRRGVSTHTDTYTKPPPPSKRKETRQNHNQITLDPFLVCFFFFLHVRPSPPLPKRSLFLYPFLLPTPTTIHASFSSSYKKPRV